MTLNSEEFLRLIVTNSWAFFFGLIIGQLDLGFFGPTSTVFYRLLISPGRTPKGRRFRCG